jgi:hypothetical protein
VTTTPETPDYMVTYAGHWQHIVENPDGSLNKDQVARELADYLMIMKHCAEIYSEVSRGRVSKPETLPSVVTGMYHEALNEAEDDAIRSLVEELEDAEQGPFASTAEVVALIRDLTGVTERKPQEG